MSTLDECMGWVYLCSLDDFVESQQQLSKRSRKHTDVSCCLTILIVEARPFWHWRSTRQRNFLTPRWKSRLLAIYHPSLFIYYNTTRNFELQNTVIASLLDPLCYFNTNKLIIWYTSHILRNSASIVVTECLHVEDISTMVTRFPC